MLLVAISDFVHEGDKLGHADPRQAAVAEVAVHRGVGEACQRLQVVRAHVVSHQVFQPKAVFAEGLNFQRVAVEGEVPHAVQQRHAVEVVEGRRNEPEVVRLKAIAHHVVHGEGDGLEFAQVEPLQRGLLKRRHVHRQKVQEQQGHHEKWQPNPDHDGTPVHSRITWMRRSGDGMALYTTPTAPGVDATSSMSSASVRTKMGGLARPSNTLPSQYF